MENQSKPVMRKGKERKKIEKVKIAKENVINTRLNAIIDIDLTEDHIDRKTIEKIIGKGMGMGVSEKDSYPVNNLALYQRSFVHVSIKTLVNKADKAFVRPYLKEPNERLEFLGDSILKAVTAEYLFRRFPNKDEGFMTKVKTRMERTEMLAHFAESIGMKGHVLMSGQAISVGGLTNPALLEDAFEAILGALYLDLGYGLTRKFIMNIFNTYMDDEIILTDSNYKDALIRYCNNVKIKVPKFVIRGTDGPAHDRTFIVDVYLYDTILYGTGIKKKKIDAEQAASKQALKKLKI